MQVYLVFSIYKIIKADELEKNALLLLSFLCLYIFSDLHTKPVLDFVSLFYEKIVAAFFKIVSVLLVMSLYTS